MNSGITPRDRTVRRSQDACAPVLVRYAVPMCQQAPNCIRPAADRGRCRARVIACSRSAVLTSPSNSKLLQPHDSSAAMAGIPGFRRGLHHGNRFRVFRQILAGLREHCPAAMPVVVRGAWLGETTLGTCSRRDSRFVIRLNHRLAETEAVDTLLHEWAHALSWNLSLDNLLDQTEVSAEDFQQACHDEAWGCAYSRVWRTHIGQILPALTDGGCR